MKRYKDLADLPEDERIDLIARHVHEHGGTVGVAVDDEEEKVERYVRKLTERGCVVVSRHKLMYDLAVLLRVSRADA